MPVQGNDARLFIGASVEAKAMLVSSLAECSRRFGTNAKTKVVPGLVVSFGQESTPGRNRALTFITTIFYFGGSVVKQEKLNICSVMAVKCSELHNELKEILRQRENPIDTKTNWCAAKELCICLTAVADTRYVCPACQSTVHAICGEVCEDASLLYHTTCFPCYARYKQTFESPDNFKLHVGSIAAAQVMDGNDVSLEEEDVFDAAGDKASVSVPPSRAEKVNKRRDYIKKLTLSQ
ncbi:Transposase IS4 [Fragilaria crotonensis]|nr:Transposase IS4 [Fragilaria crotonensis]